MQELVEVHGETCWLYMEAQQDVLDTSRLLNINRSHKMDQLKAQLLAILAGGPAQGLARALSEPKLSKIFSDPRNFDGT